MDARGHSASAERHMLKRSFGRKINNENPWNHPLNSLLTLYGSVKIDVGSPLPQGIIT